MALSVEKLLTDAHTLITHLKDHDSLADSIIGNSQALFNKVEAMKQYQDDITELNEIAKHRPRSTLVLGIAQENRQIRQLQQENRELEASLEEHQSALELIMQKYREHTVKLIQGNQIERTLKEKEVSEKNSMCHLMDKIDEMAGVMQKAIEVDETGASVDKENLSRLTAENKALREMLEICSTRQDRIVSDLVLREDDVSTQKELSDKKEESDSDGDSKTLKRQEKKPVDEDEDSSDGDTGTLKRTDGPSKGKDDTKKEDKKEDKKEAADSKKKTESKKEGSGSKEVSGTRSGSKSPVSSKSLVDSRKTRISSSPVKRTTSVTSAAKKEASSSLKKSPSVDVKKDLKSKTTAKTLAKK